MSPEPQLGAGRRQLVVPAIVTAVVALFAWVAWPSYSVNWDEALGDLFFGERNFSFFASGGEARYLDFARDPYPPERQPSLWASPFKGRPWEYYPLANTLAAASSELLARRLGWLDPFDGFHAANLLFAALWIFAFHRFLLARWGPMVAALGVALPLASPRVAADLLANVKDFPTMALFSLAAIASFSALEAGSRRRHLAAGAIWGLALATKANALFVPLVLVAVLGAGGVPASWRGRRGRLLAWSALAGALGLLVAFALWPYLWTETATRLAAHLDYLLGRHAAMRPESHASAWFALAATTPPAFLAAAAWGAALAVRGALARRRGELFLLAWIAVVMGRFALPGVVNFDGVRHFLEVFPPLAALAGIAVVDLGRRLAATSRGAIRPGLAALAFAAAAVLPGAVAVLRSHPHPLAYWNLFVGGYRGAVERGLPQAGDYWGLSYRLGLRWLTEHAERDAFLAVPVVEHAVRLTAPTWLRADLSLLPITTPFSPRIAPERLAATIELARSRPVYVMFVDRRDWANELMNDCLARLVPIAVWSYDQTPVLRIYRYVPP